MVFVIFVQVKKNFIFCLKYLISIESPGWEKYKDISKDVSNEEVSNEDISDESDSSSS